MNWQNLLLPQTHWLGQVLLLIQRNRYGNQHKKNLQENRKAIILRQKI